MRPPILAKSQQNKSLSAKKIGNKSLKNVLSQPHRIDWPILNNEQGDKLEKILKKLLPLIKSTKEKIAWPILRKMSKEERIAARKKIHQENKKEINNKEENLIIFGINAVTRSLEKNNLSCILLDSNIDPIMLVKHIVVMASNKNLPILVVKFLKSVTNETLGFSSAAIGLKKQVADLSQNNFHELFTKVSNIYLENFTSNKSTVPDESKTIDESNGTINISKSESKINLSSKIRLSSIDKNEEIIRFSTPENEINSPIKISSNVYLYKTENQKRVFQPFNLLAEQEIENNMNFISIKSDEFECLEKTPSRFFHTPNDTQHLHKKNTNSFKQNKKENKTNYISMKVKRIQGSEYRSKATKLTKIKKSKK